MRLKGARPCVLKRRHITYLKNAARRAS